MGNNNERARGVLLGFCERRWPKVTPHHRKSMNEPLDSSMRSVKNVQLKSKQAF
jgi:hypothetical protein